MRYHTHTDGEHVANARTMTPAQKTSERNARWRELIEAAQAGDLTAEETLVVLNEGLVRTFADRLLHNRCDSDLEYEDLLQAGRIGLITAIRKFDLTRNVSFATYAAWWISAEMHKARRQSLPIPVTQEQWVAISTLRQVREEMGRVNQPITTDELVTRSGLTRKTVERITQMPTVVHMAGLRTGATEHHVADAHVPAHFQELTERLDLETVLADVLTDEERVIVRKHHGLDDGEEMSLLGIARAFGWSPVRVRRLYANAIEKLKQNETALVGTVA